MPAPESPLPAALRRRSSFALVRLGLLARQRCADRLAEAGLSQHQHAILCCLDEFGPACQVDIAARLSIDTGDIVAFFDGLQRRGLVVRERDPRDRRRQIVSLTGNGQQVLRECEELLDAAEPGVLAALSAPERAELRRLTVRVLADEAPDAWAEPASQPAGPVPP
jgi:MarR family transcriptional regulator, lower aerobic nicotinate degradation pathway regulator